MRNTHIDDNILVQAAKQYGTPCLCYDENEITYWEYTLRSALPSRSKLIYSVKASPSPALITHFIRSGLYFETASDGELTVLITLGVSPDKIWVSGQGKTEEYLKNAIFYGIRHFNLESIHELEVLASLISETEKYECNLRINPNQTAKGSVIRTGGEASAFGVDETSLSSILQGKDGNLINGIFVYTGSQYFRADDIINNTEYCFHLAQRFYELTGRKLLNIDFGGGFGVPEDESNPELNTDELRMGLNNLFQQYLSKPCFSEQTSFYFESGRYLSARTACLITSIIDIKSSHGQKYLITDGGINCLGVKQSEYRLFPPYIRHLGKGGGKSEECKIVGTTCTPIDLIHPGIALNNPQIGDYICVLDCGGYSLTFSPQNFNGQYAIPEVLHSDNSCISLVRRENYHDPFGETEYVPIGSGNEILDVITKSCPKDSDEVQNIVIAAHAIKLNQTECILYDASPDGTEAVILLKILKMHYQIIPSAVYSDFSDVSCYTTAPCYPISEFITREINRNNTSQFVMLIGSEYSENDISQSIAEILRTGIQHFMKIESELISSMEHDFYSCFLHHARDFQESFDHMADMPSRRCFIEYMRTVLENDFWRLNQSPLICKYWGYDIKPYNEFYKHLEDEVWLNIGSCNGDTIFRFLRNGYSFLHIHAVDTDKDALLRCKANLNLINNTNILNRISFHHNSLGCAENQIRIDDMFQDTPLSLINMDIEGDENNVLLSAADIICRDRPVLAICAYHRPDDLYTLIETIHTICKDYLFYLRKYPNYPYHRYNSKEEIVLYAVPPERMM